MTTIRYNEGSQKVSIGRVMLIEKDPCCDVDHKEEESVIVTDISDSIKLTVLDNDNNELITARISGIENIVEHLPLFESFSDFLTDVRVRGMRFVLEGVDDCE